MVLMQLTGFDGILRAVVHDCNAPTAPGPQPSVHARDVRRCGMFGGIDFLKLNELRGSRRSPPGWPRPDAAQPYRGMLDDAERPDRITS